MEITMYVNKYKHARYTFFKWRYEVDLVYKVTLALSFACLTGLLAQLRFYLPGNPVPVTGQTFAVLLAGILLGKWGGISQTMYVGIGALGAPWFAGFNGGFAYIAGPTGGYLIGFILAAFFLGYFTDKYIRSRSFFSMLTLMLIATFILIYVPGLLHLYFFTGTSIGLWELLLMGMIPFIAGDLVKVFTAAAIAKGITPKRAYGKEVDQEKWKTWQIP
jgi:biotin transport system substrate-specific component